MTDHAGKIVRIAELEIEPAHVGAYTALLSEEIEASVEKEAGVLMLHAVAVKGSPAIIRILEVYASQQAYEAHLRTAHFLKYKISTEGMVKSLNLLDVDIIAMHAK